jgi:hypothetical protein
VKLELVLTKELFQSGCELAPEDATQRGDAGSAEWILEVERLTRQTELTSRLV